MTRLLFETHGGISIFAHAAQLSPSKSNLRDSNILLFTAGGNNRDILATFQAAIEREADSIFVVCGAAYSKIAAQRACSPRAKIFSQTLPAGKDGYLATNSLVAFSAVVMRAFGYALPARAIIHDIIVASNREWQSR